MTVITRGLAVGIVLAGAAVGLANPALANELDGNYTMTTGDGVVTHVTFTPCGPDCRQRVTEQCDVVRQFHKQGNTWVSADDKPGEVTIHMDTVQVVTIFPGVAYPMTQQLTRDSYFLA